MPLAKYNDMIQAIPPDRADQPFRMSVLPWRSGRSRPITDAHRLKAADKNIAVDGVAVADEVSWCCCPTICLGELTCDPLSRWMCGDSQPQDLAATVLQYQQSIEQSEGDCRNTNRSIDAMPSAWLCRNVLQPWDGGRLRLAMYWATVVCPTSMPSLRSSP